MLLSIDDVGFMLDDDVSVFIFKNLCKGPMDLESCISIVKEIFSIDQNQLLAVKIDIEEFLSVLTEKNVLLVS